MRLKNTIIMTDTCELADVTPTRFLGLIIRPVGEISKASEMGKVMGTLMSDQVDIFERFQNKNMTTETLE